MSNLRESTSLVRCFIDIFIYIRSISKLVDSELVDITSKLDTKFRNSAKLALTTGIDIRDYDNARFAVCALLDELLMSKKWKYQNQWKECLFQKKYYGTTNAGSEFFDRLSSIGLSKNSVREVYVLCLVFGFCGEYSRSDDISRLYSLRDEEYKRIKQYRFKGADNILCSNKISSLDTIDCNIFGSGQLTEKLKNKGYIKIIAISIIIITYVLYSLILNYQLSSVTYPGVVI